MFTHCQLFYVSIIIPVTRVRVVVGGGDYILKAIIIITIFMPVTAYNVLDLQFILRYY
ncbi:hypothetical protein SDC9_50950 [bioreactor metagenome]|uniref:Uncharacterized protein n=1 Tax=bioreactor metagenome TaxID=1076179 RepID=A0A644WME9_9ZZZZ